MAGSPRKTIVFWLPGARVNTRESPSAVTSRSRYSVTVSLPGASQVSVYIPGCGPLERTRRFAGARMLGVAVAGVDGAPGVPVGVEGPSGVADGRPGEGVGEPFGSAVPLGRMGVALPLVGVTVAVSEGMTPGSMSGALPLSGVAVAVGDGVPGRVTWAGSPDGDTVTSAGRDGSGTEGTAGMNSGAGQAPTAVGVPPVPWSDGAAVVLPALPSTNSSPLTVSTAAYRLYHARSRIPGSGLAVSDSSGAITDRGLLSPYPAPQVDYSSSD